MDSEAAYMRYLGRKVKRGIKTPDMSAYVKRRIGKVKSVSGSTVTVDFGSTSTPMPVTGLRIVKSCSGIKAGDSVVVDTVDHVSLVTAILA